MFRHACHLCDHPCVCVCVLCVREHKFVGEVREGNKNRLISSRSARKIRDARREVGHCGEGGVTDFEQAKQDERQTTVGLMAG